jgi:hypothetical protein
MANFSFPLFSKENPTPQAGCKEPTSYLNYLIQQIRPYINIGKYYDALRQDMRQSNNFYQAFMQIENRDYVIAEACQNTMASFINNPYGEVPKIMAYCKAYALLYQGYSISLADIFGCHRSSPDEYINTYLKCLKTVCHKDNLNYEEHRSRRYIKAQTLANYPWLTKVLKLYKLLIDQKLIQYDATSKPPQFMKNNISQWEPEQHNGFFQQFANIMRGKDMTYNDWRVSSLSNACSRHRSKEYRHPFECLIDRDLENVFSTYQRESSEDIMQQYQANLTDQSTKINTTSHNANSINLCLNVTQYLFQCRRQIYFTLDSLYKLLFSLNFLLQKKYNLQLWTEKEIQQQHLSIKQLYQQAQKSPIFQHFDPITCSLVSTFGALLATLTISCNPKTLIEQQVLNKIKEDTPGILSTLQRFTQDLNNAYELIKTLWSVISSPKT